LKQNATTHLLKCLKFKTTPNGDKKVEQWKFTFTIGGNGKMVTLKTVQQVLTKLSIPLSYG
jgi:hypothetical protein